MEKQDYDGPILEIDKLSISFFTRLREIPAVMDFSATIQPGEALGLVGESGCGKSTVALGVMQDLGVNGRIVGGSIKFKGEELNTMSPDRLRDIRGSEIAMIYQEPMASLNPAMKIAKQLMEVPMIHEGVSEAEAYARALEVVTDVKLPDPERILKSYPHQLSGGQQQRIVIAMALMSKPSIPGNFPLPHERPQGCNFGPRCDYFEKGLCDQGFIPMYPADPSGLHETRCLKFNEIDWNAPIELGEQKQKAPVGDVVLKMDNLKKYYEVAANALFGGGDKKVVKANETLSFEARESETLAIVGESGCGKSTFAKVLMGLETATEGDILLDNQSIGSTAIENRDTKTVADIQMVFQNPFDTLNPSMTVGRQIMRALEIFKIGKNDAERRERMLKLLDLVKLPPYTEALLSAVPIADTSVSCGFP